jgi:hypothetical protein
MPVSQNFPFSSEVRRRSRKNSAVAASYSVARRFFSPQVIGLVATEMVHASWRRLHAPHSSSERSPTLHRCRTTLVARSGSRSRPAACDRLLPDRLSSPKCSFSAARCPGPGFGLIPVPGSFAAAAFPVPALSRRVPSQNAAARIGSGSPRFWVLQENGTEKEEIPCTYMLSGIGRSHSSRADVRVIRA